MVFHYKLAWFSFENTIRKKTENLFILKILQ